MHLYPCARVNNCYSCHRADARRAIKLIFCCCNATRGEQIHNSVFSKFSESMYIPQYMLFFFIYLKFMWNRNVSFSAADASRIWNMDFMLFVCIPKKGVWIQNSRYCRFTGHNTRKSVMSIFNVYY